MTIKSKLFLGFGTLMVLMFVLAAIGFNRLTTIDESMTEIYSNRYMKVHLTAELRNDTTDLAKAMSDLLLMDDPSTATKNMETIRRISSQISKALTQIDVEFKGETEQPLVADILKKGKKHLEYKDDVLRLVRSGKKDEATVVRTSVGNASQTDFLDSITAMTHLQEDAMEQALNQSQQENNRTYTITGVLTLVTLLIGISIMFWIVIGVTRGLGMLSGVITNFGNGQGPGSYRVPIQTTDEFADIGRIFNQIAEDLEGTTANERALSKLNAEQAWLQTHIAHVSTQMQGARQMEAMAKLFIFELCRIIGAQSGAIYIAQGEGRSSSKKYVCKGTYASALSQAPELTPAFLPGEGLIGQCVVDRQPLVVKEIPAGYLKISSAFGEVAPAVLEVRPILFLEEVVGVFEVAALNSFDSQDVELMDRLSEIAAVTIHRISGQQRVEELLRISQMLTDELQSQSEELLSQQDELKASNEKLEEQTKALQASEEQLQHQQDHLEQTNEELLRQTKLLEEQIRETEAINRQIEDARDVLEKQALELAYASKYKSEFLANMSHELRTPLNSLLILAQLLKENKERNLNGKQVEYAETILSSGTDLLKLIDDVLDLSKVESGRMELHEESLLLEDLVRLLHRSFMPIAKKKKLVFDIRLDEQLPDQIITDSLRLQQILKNLLSNAFKFTAEGSVTLSIRRVEDYPDMISFEVTDTGIGIPEEKQKMVFEAFQQADGTTSRNYGGTGLGLSISRQLAALLGGCIELESAEGNGSCFTVYVPLSLPASPHNAGEREAAAAFMNMDKTDHIPMVEPRSVKTAIPVLVLRPVIPAETISAAALASNELQDDRDSIEEGDRLLLIVEDDVHFARILMDMARGRGFKTMAALQGDIGLEMARQYRPDAILLDIQLPVIDGWSILVHLKNEALTRHIPVHVISVVDEIQQGLSMGAIAYLQKPSSKESLEQAFTQLEAFLDNSQRKLLLVGKDESQRASLIDLIDHDDVQIIAVSGGIEAWDELQHQAFDCLVIDMGPHDLAEFELLDKIKSDEGLRRLPIVIYTTEQWNHKEKLRLRKYAESIIMKDVKSPERLLDETALFLHRVEENLPEEKRLILQKLHNREDLFAGKKVLLVDDDIRNVFALSNLLEGYGMLITFAETGEQALEQLQQDLEFDLVLMDIMMPVMDGYEAIRRIRSQPAFDRLPIIALTAKAMKGDRQKCMEAGASDYITKPIHTEQLLSLIRVWLCK